MAVELAEMDSHVRFAEQLQQETGPVVLINAFSVDPADAERFLDIWAADAAFMKQQPGFISTQLHQGTAGSGSFMNVAVWESAAELAAAVTSPEFRAFAARYPDGTVARPHVYEKVAVLGVCVR